MEGAGRDDPQQGRFGQTSNLFRRIEANEGRDLATGQRAAREGQAGRPAWTTAL